MDWSRLKWILCILSCFHLEIFFGEEKLSWLPSKSKVLMKIYILEAHKFYHLIIIFSVRTSFHQLLTLFLEGSQLIFSSLKEIHQMKAGQYKIHLTNLVQIHTTIFMYVWNDSTI
jgi:hypothetical protein